MAAADPRDAVSGEPITFNIEFTLPDYNASKRHTVGGARGQMDITEATVEAWNELVTLAVRHKGAVFGAVIVVLLENEPEEKPKRIRGWKEPRLKK
jgi:hypothetical protein